MDGKKQNSQRKQAQDNDQKPAESKEKVEEDLETHFSDIDESYVDHIKGADVFEIFFDKKLYEPPVIIVESEKRLAELTRQKNKK